jgi:acyl carrier protein
MTTLDRIDALFQRDFRISAARLGTALKPETHLFDDLEFDSLDRTELVLRAEEEFGIEITEGQIDTLATIADLIAIVDGGR